MVGLALPTEARQLGDIKDLAPSLGKSRLIEPQSVSEGRPKPAGPADGEKSAPDGSPPALLLLRLGARLRKLAASVRSIGDGYQHNPEAILQRKQEIAAQLEQLAALVEGGPR